MLLVAPAIGVPPEVEFVVFVYHWYVGTPTPFWVTIVNWLATPSRQTSESRGWVTMVGVGLTITVKTSTGSPMQLSKIGVTVYTTFPGILPLLIKVWLGISAVEPLEINPEISVLLGTVVEVQVYVVLGLLEVKGTAIVLWFEQISWVVIKFVITGFSKTSNSWVVEVVPHSFVTSRVMVKTPGVSYAIFSGFSIVEDEGEPPGNNQL